MGLFDFIRGIGRKVDEDKIEQTIYNDITNGLGDRVENLSVAYDGGTVTLSGMVDYNSTKQKAVLLAGNVEHVDKVDDTNLTVKPLDMIRAEAEEALAEAAAAEPAFTFYTVQRGDSLSKIAKAHYGNANKWTDLFEANKEVIKNPDLIYPGQQIRVPANPDA